MAAKWISISCHGIHLDSTLDHGTSSVFYFGLLLIAFYPSTASDFLAK